jgi:hypothetical protein
MTRFERFIHGFESVSTGINAVICSIALVGAFVYILMVQ